MVVESVFLKKVPYDVKDRVLENKEALNARPESYAAAQRPFAWLTIEYGHFPSRVLVLKCARMKVEP